MSTLTHRFDTALYDRLTAIGQGLVAPLTAHVHAVQQGLAAAVVESGRRMVADTLAPKQAELDQLLGNMKRRDTPGDEVPAVLVVHLIVRPE